MAMDGGEQTRIRTAMARSLLEQYSLIRLRLTKQGFELTAEGESDPVICESWPRAKRVLKRLGVPDGRMNAISTMLSEGSEIIVRISAEPDLSPGFYH